MSKINNMPLTYKQKAFCEFYTGECNGNAHQSAMKAGYKIDTASEQGCRLLTNVKIKNYINEILAVKAKDMVYNKVTAEQMLMDLIHRCQEAQDRSTEATAIKELNTINALRTENYNTTDLTQQKALEDIDKVEAERIANIRLSQVI